LTNWVAEMILTQSDVKKRVVVIKHFVSVADVSHTRIIVMVQILMVVEMPDAEQFLYSHIHHFSSRYGADTSIESNMASSQCANIHHSRTNAQTHG